MRDAILAILLNNTDRFVSGQDMSRSLGITRAAVWKYIKLFENEGYVIESSTKKGYRLKLIPDIMDRVVLTNGLKTSIIGRNMECYQNLASTNARAKEMALADAPEGTVIIAEEQSRGRGRLGRNWVSPAGKGVWMSVILKPRLSPEKAPRITIMTAVALVRALKQAAELETGIKWPNDIVCNGKKLCGILTEIHAQPDIINYAVVGIGINVNLSVRDFPEDIRNIATSIKIEKGREFRRSDILQAVLENMEDMYLNYFDDDNFERLLQEYRDYSVVLGKKISVAGPTGEFSGKALDFGEDGSLLIQGDGGKVEKLWAGDVSIRGEKGYV
ncbi:MAG: biotin--[acetyl-CoA-carboxylase] ligase [Clostridiales bacterium]|jgi:BirA family biotin operon repressor/biotin-[acetyl-CoA-carboxylase] ligase|nr:biotin--[acetyl-CoA-carboxylase] ligase [Clostridiales bacterium]